MNYKKTVEEIGDKINEYSGYAEEDGVSLQTIEDEANVDVDKATTNLLNKILKEKSNFTDLLIGSSVINDKGWLQVIMTEIDSQEIQTANQLLQALIHEIIRLDIHSATFPLDIEDN